MKPITLNLFSSSKKLINRRAFIIGVISTLLALSTSFFSFAHTERDFKSWINEFKKIALANNISSTTFDMAFKTVETIDPAVLQKAAYQPEFIDSPWNYFDNRVHNIAIVEGQRHAQKWEPWLSKIEKRFGVNRNILLAIWSIESSYGKVLQNKNVMHDVIRSLATLAYADQKRKKYAYTQLIAAMKILQSSGIHRSQLIGSWAGALGHTQFIPTSYLAYGVDMDGDGRCNIWTSIPDALATAANLLHMNGWQSDLPWGVEVKLPHRKKLPEDWLSFEQWAKLGVRHAHGQPFPSSSQLAILKFPDGPEGPIFLVTKNFFVIKRYNNADRYAFAVALLANRIAGHPGLVQDWNRPFKPITFQERLELQSRLAALGDYKGEIDGKIGTASKQAIKSFQLRHGLEANGYPSYQVLSLLRKQ
ncbi:lytic murein transglycosylase [Bartonella schoenbuchensis]|uniref:Membrane-bound lytic murein transglycosylase B n=2 Tax=Bartonella schoenbuchensis TaxID=165694 RepID=E6YXZ1_BARSR|nr:lytic murein transglycosylase [Bartonella schoenbuchensis]AQX30264.1 membrane-bound lytic murein transglycosylase B [Bartonella schoenbuchensis R1]CBI81802.1 peptidoglycan-binding protein [Bartonella schoenbuchensis R1]CDP79757.1 membrane-bound lytic murein transglycosylase [Bartonella schoenbuchensis]